jgi:hypothetical protein
MTDLPEMSEYEAMQEEVKGKTRFEIDCLLRSVAVTNPELSPGQCRDLVADALFGELGRMWDTWDDPIIRDEERIGGTRWPEPF